MLSLNAPKNCVTNSGSKRFFVRSPNCEVSLTATILLAELNQKAQFLHLHHSEDSTERRQIPVIESTTSKTTGWSFTKDTSNESSYRIVIEDTPLLLSGQEGTRAAMQDVRSKTSWRILGHCAVECG